MIFVIPMFLYWNTEHKWY